VFPVLVRNAIQENTAIFNFTQNGTNQSVVSNSSNASEWKRKIMYPIKISACAGMTTLYIYVNLLNAFVLVKLDAIITFQVGLGKDIFFLERKRRFIICEMER
jgi:hypothetical protein